MSNLPKIHSEYSSTYKKINVSGIFGGIVSGGVEAIIYSEERIIDKVLETEPIEPQKMAIKRTIEAELLIDPMQMKSLHEWLDNKIKEYEKIFGHIPTQEDISKKTIS